MDSLFQALDGAADGAYVIDEDQHIVYWNRAAEEILGYTSEEVLGRACYEVIGGLDDEGHRLCRHHCYVATTALTGSQVASYDTCAQTKSGQTCWLNVTILIFAARDTNSTLIVHLFRDATDKKQTEHFTRQVLGAAKSLQQGTATQPHPSVGSEKSVVDLTEREREVLSLLVQGLSSREISESLSISPSTARNHVQNILHKLNVHSRLEAVAYAFEHRLV